MGFLMCLHTHLDTAGRQVRRREKQTRLLQCQGPQWSRNSRLPLCPVDQCSPGERDLGTVSRWAFQGQVQASNVWEFYTLSPLKRKTTVGRLSKATNWLEWDLNLGLPGSSLSSCLASGLWSQGSRGDYDVAGSLCLHTLGK